MAGMKDKIKELAAKAVEDFAPSMAQLAGLIAETPELGYFEFNTSAKVKKALEDLGLTVQSGLARTGLKAEIMGEKPGPTVAVIGELDGIPSPDHPSADSQTGASHACGHNLQITEMVGVAAALSRPEVKSGLAGRVVFMAVPAEEFIEIDRRMALRESGEVAFLGGKQELVRLGAFDDVDMAMMVHAGGNTPEPGFDLPDDSLGFRAFSIRYEGRAAHAAGAPHEGVNALNAAILGINGVNALRETFRDDDGVRVHFIITKGGDTVNSVPADVRLEGYVRAKSARCIASVFDKVMAAFEGGARATGAVFHLNAMPGYLPLKCSRPLNELFALNAERVLGAENVRRHVSFSASTDMGDLTHLMPAIHPLAGGTDGSLHAADFRVDDFDAAVVAPAKVMAMTVVDLLADDGSVAREILAGFKAPFDKESYLAELERAFQSRRSPADGQLVCRD